MRRLWAEWTGASTKKRALQPRSPLPRPTLGAIVSRSLVSRQHCPSASLSKLLLPLDGHLSRLSSLWRFQRLQVPAVPKTPTRNPYYALTASSRCEYLTPTGSAGHDLFPGLC